MPYQEVRFMSRKRRVFSPVFKAKVALAAAPTVHWPTLLLVMLATGSGG